MVSSEHTYLNTLAFTVIAEAITVVILGILAFDGVKPYAPFLVSIEIGLLIVIIWSLYSIYKHKSQMELNFKTMKNATLYNISCPDYFVRDGNEEGHQICRNQYETPDGNIRYKFIGVNNETKEPIEEIDMSVNINEKKLDHICPNLLAPGAPYGNIPWTGIKPSCTDISDFDDVSAFREESK
jgi:hypothetical protein